MKIDTFKVGIFELRKVGEEIQHYIDDEQVLYVELAWDSPENVPH
ncbi:UNVERIFIED_ORG: hypothetical protein FHW05_002216 [Pantoea agglomerans]